MGVSFDSSEVRKLAADLELGRQRVGRDVSRTVRAAAERVKSGAQGKAPVGATGDLRGSIGVSLMGDGRSVGMSAAIEAKIRYAYFNEFGTAKMAPQPFMGPALQEEAPRFAEELSKALGGVLG